MFKRFQALKKGVETIKKVAPSVGSALGKKKVDLLKKMGKTQRKSPENFKKAGGDKLKKEILAAETRVKKAEGGMLEKAKKFLGKEAPKRKPKSKEEINRIVNSDAYKKADYKGKTEMLGGKVFTAKEMEEKIKKQKPSIKEQIMPKKKMDRLKELRKELK